MEIDDGQGRLRRRALLGGSAAAAVGLLGLSAGPAQADGGGRAQAGGGGREGRNKRRLAQVFRGATERGTLNKTNDFYLDILHPDVEWTVMAEPRRIYSNRADFLAGGSAPVLERLATPLYPDVHAIYADGDVVSVLWDGTATALDGQPYLNTFNWVFTMRGRQAIRVRAYLDLIAVNNLVERVPLPTT